ncbi:phosphotransferase [Flexivirga oryzae]|uniref:Aminoglycoside phosphotransferase domain-containing protein n=1 Tax=Flexivirga oryzae TaxID=1794944 RepID=A0A839N8Y0_9MICO|nr:hypothetical protein [Flexivirga oryzae]
MHVTAVDVRPIDYAWGSVPTAGLWQVTAHFDGGGYRYFVKLLRHPRLWPGLASIPEQYREEFLDALPWRFEYDMHRSGIEDVLPDGMRMPRLHHVKTIDDAYVALWWEFIDIDTSPWATADFALTAYLLGRLAGRRKVGAEVNRRMPTVASIDNSLRYFVEHRVLLMTVPALHDRSVWQHPLLAEALHRVQDPSLPDDMRGLADRIPAILDHLDALPQTYAHGDAGPQNLLIPAADRSQRVVIDWGFGTPLPIGFDLGQLLIGLAHAGELAPDRLREIDAAILPAYLEGLADEHYIADPVEVRFGYVGSMAARSALCALPLELLDTTPTEADLDLLVDRVRLTRVLVDMAPAAH